MALTTLAAAGGYLLDSSWPDRYANVITGFVLIAIGTLIFTHVL